MLTGMHCKLAGTNRQRSRERTGQVGEVKRQMLFQTYWARHVAPML